MIKNYKIKILEPEKHKDFNVGQCLWILYVNRNTLEMGISFEDPWPEYNRKKKAELDTKGLELCEDGFSVREKNDN